MSQALRIDDEAALTRQSKLSDPRYQAFEILHWGFVAAPVLAGLDKFAGLLANWDGYLSPAFARLSPLSVCDFVAVVWDSVAFLLQAWSEHIAQRPRQERGEINQLRHCPEPQDHQHQHSEALRRRERADGKYG